MLELHGSKFCSVFVANLPLYCIFLLVFWWLIYLVLDYVNSYAYFGTNLLSF